MKTVCLLPGVKQSHECCTFGGKLKIYIRFLFKANDCYTEGASFLPGCEKPSRFSMNCMNSLELLND